MYLHLGSSVIIPLRDVVGIFDLDNTTAAKSTRDLLTQAEQQGQVITVGEDLPKSFLLCRDSAGNRTIYLCQLSPATLFRRAEQGGLVGF